MEVSKYEFGNDSQVPTVTTVLTVVNVKNKGEHVPIVILV